MKLDRLAYTVATGAMSLAMASGAHALTININAGAALTANAAALAAFERAADAWESIFSDPVTVNIDADMAALGNNTIIGTTSNVLLVDSYNTVRNQMVADAADEASNGIVAALPTLAQFTASVPNGFSLTGNLVATKANLKALGFNAATLDTAAGTTNDATIRFNTNFAFDFDNSNGVAAGTKDFETVAAHEVGHALGFISIVDLIDLLVNGNKTLSVPPSTLDLFRFNTATDPNSPGTFATATRELRPGQAAVFDDLDNEYAMATGEFTGDGDQASHWKADELSGSLIGIFDPTLQNGFVSPITAADIRALDLIGWDVAAQAVPAPAGILVALFGLAALGTVVQRRI